MRYNPHVHHRRSIRLAHWDYAETGGYFVTLCSYGREAIFGEVIGGEVRLSAFGQFVGEEWLMSSELRREVGLDEFVIMPNHFHAIVFLQRGEGATSLSPLPRIANGPSPRSLGALVAGFKIASTKRINVLRGTPGQPVWQRNYYERVLRNERELGRARKYVADNPAKWDEDVNNPRSPDFRVLSSWTDDTDGTAPHRGDEPVAPTRV